MQEVVASGPGAGNKPGSRSRRASCPLSSARCFCIKVQQPSQLAGGGARLWLSVTNSLILLWVTLLTTRSIKHPLCTPRLACRCYARPQNGAPDP